MLEAKTRLSQLVEAAERGEQVFLKSAKDADARRETTEELQPAAAHLAPRPSCAGFLEKTGVLVAQIVPIRKSKFPFGFLKDQPGSVSDSLLFGPSEEELADFPRP